MKKTASLFVVIAIFFGFIVFISIGGFTVAACDNGMGSSDIKPNVIVPDIEMVMIPAGTFTMGSPTSELGRSHNENQYEVKKL